MIRYLGSLPRKCIIAFSGGVDSVAIADFLLNGKRDIELAFFHHGTETSDRAQEFVINFSTQREVKLHLGKISREKLRHESHEEYWRNERYAFLSQFLGPVVTAHHLDDAVESWIFSSLHGEGKLIPPKRGNVIRPFLVTPKQELKDWCAKRKLDWSEDLSNEDSRYMRNYIRNEIIPKALHVNPGLSKVIKKKYVSLNNTL